MQIVSSFIREPLKVVNKAPKLLKTAYLHRTASIHPEPIIILGNPKAGTTVIAALLGKATGKEVIIDPLYQIKNNVNFRKKLQAKKVTFKNFIQKHKFYFSSEIIKDPYFIFIYEEILECFPKAKKIFISREPSDNIRSILNRLKIPGNLQFLDDYYKNKLPKEGAWKLVLEGQLPFVPGNNYIENLAYRWNLATDIYMANRDYIVLIRYEDFMKNKVDAITHLAKHIGLDPIHDISDRVNVKYQPSGNRNVDLIEIFGKDNLQKIETICGERIKYFDY